MLCFLLGLSGCSGGSGGGESSGSGSLTVTFNQNPLQVTKYQWDLPSTINVDAVVQGYTSASSVYVYIIDQGNTISAGQVQIDQIGQDTYQAMLTLPASTSIGEHDGSLQLRLCADPNCNTLLNSSTLPYRITVQSNPTLQAMPSPATLVGIGVSHTGYATALGLRLPTFTFQGTPVYPIYIQATDSGSVFGLPYNQYGVGNGLIAGPFNQNIFQLSFVGGGNLTPGSYSGVLTLTFCHDEQCTKVFDGSSALPYTLTVTANNLTPLSPVANVPDWQGLDGGPSHDGSAPITVSVDNLAPRWVVSTDPNGNDSYPADPHPLTGDDKVYLNSFVLTALNEVDGSVAWTGNAYSRGPMSSANGTIYLDSPDSLYGIDEADGSQIFTNNGIDVSYSWVGPVAIGSKVLLGVSSNSYQQISGFNGQTGAAEGAPSCLQSIEQTYPTLNLLPALDSQLNAYIMTDSGLMVANFGANPGCHKIATTGTGFAGPPIYVSTNSDVLLNAESSLVDFNTQNSTVKWNVQIPQSLIHDDNAVANGVVYVVANNAFEPPELQAYSEANGKLLWSWSLLEPFSEGLLQTGMVVTNNVIFVQGYDSLYAVDLSTHQAVWSLNSPGAMAISANGILYVNYAASRMDSKIMAINLH